MRWCRMRRVTYPAGRAARHFLRLPQDARAVAHIVVEDLGWGRHRGIAEAQHVGVELTHFAEAQGIGLFVKRDGMLFTARHVAHDDARQCILALHADEPVLQHDQPDEEATGPVRHEVGPVFRRRIADGRCDNLVVSAPPRLVLMMKRSSQCSRSYSMPSTRGAINFGASLGFSASIIQTLGRIVVMDVDQNVFLGIGLSDAGEYAVILLLIDEPVVGLRGTEHMLKVFNGR